MKTNRILFAITLISSPLLLNAYHEGSDLRATGGSTLVGTSTQKEIIHSQGTTPTTGTGAGIVAPVSGRSRVLGQEYRDDKKRYFGNQPERRDSGMVVPLRK